MSGDGRTNELGAFLRARRAELTPREVGLPDTGPRRRVRGLRREEVAVLVSISTDYYTRIEQGRRQASEPVLAALARVLRLDEEERAYLLELAGRGGAARPRRRAERRVQPALRRLLAELTTTPALVLGRRMDILDWNPMAAALLTDFARVPERHRNYIWLLFSDPAMRALHAHWEESARSCVAMLRGEAGRDPEDPRMAALVGELSVRDDDFRRWWGDHRVAARVGGSKTLRHPVAGELVLDWDTVASVTAPEQQLVLWTAEPGTPTHEGLRFLASWAGDAARSAPPSAR
ncbi:helix-turn-helix domain-containing protein [Streptomyces sp. 3MP-14]|uniref:Helix-turn-helix domain-containing protein n=1 Tax=Streptomyces mimosae TaxID=2586635 RepID=A0A5N5ZN17_9ACTN|nr:MULTISPECIES: helix-turn-helix domain-containing protein [Streptomyces]KAB8157887.1 helix-turn-helix domain-containing protein [Streptomyces mimosae]KAB8172388.1 helix-turn-helix domain-containing protein [Streptomyces sp. 3MP-14]